MHRSLRRRRYPLSVVVPLMLLACERPTTAVIAPSRAEVRSASFPGSRYKRPAEAQLVAFAKQLPGFAGYYLDSADHLVVYQTDSTKQAGTLDAISAALAGGGLGISAKRTPASVVVRHADYDFIQLSDWRDSITAHLLPLDGIVGDGIDLSTNRINVKVLKSVMEQMKPMIAANLQQLGVPQRAVVLEGTNPVSSREGLLGGMRSLRKAAAMTQTDTLAAGQQIHLQAPDGGSSLDGLWCTIGVIGTDGTHNYGSAASHCSVSSFGVDSTRYLSNPSFQYAGFESIDPHSNGSDCGFLGLQTCWNTRNSDFNLFVLDAGGGLSGSVLWNQGALAHTSTRYTNTTAQSNMNALDLALTGTFWINSTISSETQGDVVDKMGATTGWSTGTVHNTCYDTKLITDLDNKHNEILCATESYVWCGQGDSGGPFFDWSGSGNAIRFRGALFAGSDDYTNNQGLQMGGTCYYATYPSIVSDLGFGLGVLTPGQHDLGTISVTTSIGSGGSAALSWTTVTNATEYHVYEFQCPDGYNDGEPFEIGVTTSTSYTDGSGYTHRSSARPRPGQAFTAYMVVPYNMYVGEGTPSSWTYYY